MFTCAICNSKSAHEALCITQPDRFERHLGINDTRYERRWVSCAVCGAATNILPPVSEKKLTALRGSYYEVDFAGSSFDEKYCRVMALPDSLSDNAGRVARIIAFAQSWFPPGTRTRIMDIGAGTGVFLSRLMDETKGCWTGVALEPDPIAAEHLRKIGKFQVIEAMYQGQPELKDFDLVTLNKVLEHIAEPLPFLKRTAKAIQQENGLIYIEVPDKLTMGLRAPSDNILGALHCHLYDPVSLGYLMRAAGIEPVRIERVAEPSGKLTVYAFGTRSETLNQRYAL